MCTVKDLMQSLAKLPEDARVEIAIRDANKWHPVAYCTPEQSEYPENGYCWLQNGTHARINVKLESNDTHYTTTTQRKRK